MTVIKCKMCGGDLALAEGSSTAQCEYCGTLQTIPNLDDEKKLIQFERAERLRKQCEFDKAAGIYETIVADFRQEAEAYWGLVLCKYGIEYVDDPATGKKIPTCHRSSFDSILEDSDFEQALENADVMARKVYREEAKKIEEIRNGILSVSNNEQPYDIFICYKETDEKGGRTLDSVLAQDVYDTLTDKGYRVFFSRITLEDKLGMEYEPYIFAALNSAKVMLVFGTDYEYYNAVWVKNEWSRFLKLMAKDKDKHLIPCYKGIDAYDMPKEFAKLQAQDMGKIGAMQDLLRGIEKLIPRKTETPKAAPQVDNTHWDGFYSQAKMAMDLATTEKACKEAAHLFENIHFYLDAAALAKKCYEKAETLRRDEIYNSAVSKLTEDAPLSALKQSLAEFKSIAGWRDANEQIEICQERIRELQEQTAKRGKLKKRFILLATLLAIELLAMAIIYNIVNDQRAKRKDEDSDKTYSKTYYYTTSSEDGDDDSGIAGAKEAIVVRPAN